MLSCILIYSILSTKSFMFCSTNKEAGFGGCGTVRLHNPQTGLSWMGAVMGRSIIGTLPCPAHGSPASSLPRLTCSCRTSSSYLHSGSFTVPWRSCELRPSTGRTPGPAEGTLPSGLGQALKAGAANLSPRGGWHSSEQKKADGVPSPNWVFTRPAQSKVTLLFWWWEEHQRTRALNSSLPLFFVCI